ncbi:hemolysin III family protein [Bradyrhizobium diazoefficiens]|nr:hemolysin III family protein [Bradyrhizobium diazoefficiens]QQO23410.1 hemolysin III family protein [Bradyrhizobium diazoefficiens]
MSSCDYTADSLHPSLVEAGAIEWNYTRAEVMADGVVHAFGVSLGFTAGPILIAVSLSSAALPSVAVTIYVAGLLSMLACSAAFNLWPVSRTKWLLRRLDHSAIFLLIASTYTPFAVELEPSSSLAVPFLVSVWSAAALGVLLKLAWPGRFEQAFIGSYLALGWSGIMFYGRAEALYPASVLCLVAAGGAVYTVGVIFHLWQSLRFQNAIWHCFVLLGAACHYAAVLGLVLS